MPSIEKHAIHAATMLYRTMSNTTQMKRLIYIPNNCQETPRHVSNDSENDETIPPQHQSMKKYDRPTP
jgi:hypothetical protein